MNATLATPEYIKALSRAYDMAPICTSEAVRAWEILADETSTHYYSLKGALDIVITTDSEPYENAHDMIHDIANGRIIVSEANSEHPLWDRDENIRFRVVHDVIGHATTGAGFDFRGELRAYEKHLSITNDPKAKLALFTEAVGQVAFALDTGAFGVQKCAILPQYLQWSHKEIH